MSKPREARQKRSLRRMLQRELIEAQRMEAIQDLRESKRRRLRRAQLTKLGIGAAISCAIAAALAAVL